VTEPDEDAGRVFARAVEGMVRPTRVGESVEVPAAELFVTADGEAMGGTVRFTAMREGE
jgi:hypothetical protein